MAITKRLAMEIAEFADTVSLRFSNEPLDGDEVDIIVGRFSAELNLRQGNITLEEYNNDENVMKWNSWFDCEVFPKFIKKD